MKNYIIVLLMVAASSNLAFAQTTAKHHHKTAKKSTPCNTMTASSMHHHKHYGKGIAKHHAGKKYHREPMLQTINIDDRYSTAIISIKDGDVFVNDSLVAKVKNPKYEDDRIIINYITPPPPAPITENIEHIKINSYTGQKGAAMLGVYAGDDCAGGVFVDDIMPFSSADKAGMYPGDVITKIDDHDINNQNDLRTAIDAHNAGDVVSVTFKDHDGTETKQVELTNKEEVPNCGCAEMPMRRWGW